jgi:hypothetical protein
LDLAGISEECSLEDFQSVVKVVIGRCVTEKDGQKRVLTNFTHLAYSERCKNKTLCGMLSKVLDVALADVNEVDQAWLGLPTENVDLEVQKTFIAAIADRAMDLSVIGIVQGTGLEDDWAGAALRAAYPVARKAVPHHVVAFLIKQKVWVFGDYSGVDGEYQGDTRRVVQRILYRVMAGMMTVKPDPADVKKLQKT